VALIQVTSSIPQEINGGQEVPEHEEDLFDPEFGPGDDDDGDEFDESDVTEEELEEGAQPIAAPYVIPELPAILFYDSASHGHRRYYQNSLQGKPSWGKTKDEAFVFDNADHLKLAGENCKAWGYSGLDLETVK
jgi:hypothetical protein